MYVRWKRYVRAHQPPRLHYTGRGWTRIPAEFEAHCWEPGSMNPENYPTPPPTVLLSVQLVKSERVNGKPRQRIIAHLATVGEASIGTPSYSFWMAVNERLTEVVQDEAERERYKVKIGERMPRLTDEQMAQGKQEHEALLAFVYGRGPAPSSVVPTTG